MTLSERLKEERKRLGLTQQEMSAIAGIERRGQVRYESGERCPDGHYLAAIAAAGADVAYILTGARTQPLRALGELPGEREVKGGLKGGGKRASVREETATTYAAEDPLARRKAMLKLLIDQMQDPKLLDALQTELEEIERVKGLERRVAELERKAG